VQGALGVCGSASLILKLLADGAPLTPGTRSVAVSLRLIFSVILDPVFILQLLSTILLPDLLHIVVASCKISQAKSWVLVFSSAIFSASRDRPELIRLTALYP
jgi:hypothetical protein